MVMMQIAHRQLRESSYTRLKKNRKFHQVYTGVYRCIHGLTTSTKQVKVLAIRVAMGLAPANAYHSKFLFKLSQRFLAEFHIPYTIFCVQLQRKLSWIKRNFVRRQRDNAFIFDYIIDVVVNQQSSVKLIDTVKHYYRWKYTLNECIMSTCVSTR